MRPDFFGLVVVNYFLLLFDLIKTEPLAVVKTGVLLTIDSPVAYDYNIVKPALRAGYDEALRRFNVEFQEVLCLYHGEAAYQGCSQTNAVGMTYECAVTNDVDLIVGPGCTDDMMASLELQTVLKVPSVTGGGDLVDSSAKFPYVTRCSYNTYTQWTFLVNVCQKFGWTNVAVIYNKENPVKAINGQSLVKNLKDHFLTPQEYPMLGSTIMSPTDAEQTLLNASNTARVFVILAKGEILRKFMLSAQTLGLTNGDYVFFSLDPFRDDILGPNGWKQGDLYDQNAMLAYQSLIVLTLRDTTQTPQYQDFAAKVNATADRDFPGMKVTLSYYVASFFDSILVYAASVNKTYEAGQSTNNEDNVFNISTEQWDKSLQGATGLVYINPLGDRNDDHAMYAFGPSGDPYVVAFYYGYKGFGDNNPYQFDPEAGFRWLNPSNAPPMNEPRCGYLGDKPICDTSRQTLGVSLGIVGFLLAASILAGVFIYRYLSKKSELAQLDLLGTWRDVTKIHVPQTKAAKSAEEMGSHISVSQKTMFDDANLPSQTVTAVYHGAKTMLRMCEPALVEITSGVLGEIKKVRSITHDNVLRLQGLCCGPGRVAVMYVYCAKGSLSDLLLNETVKLDWIFRFSFLKNIMEGLAAITTALGCHGRLKSKCVFVDSHFMARIGDYGLPSFFARTVPFSQGSSNPDSVYCAGLLWTAPELLDDPFSGGTPEGDVYSYSIILSEVIMRQAPFASDGLPPETIIAKIQKKSYKPYRPRIDASECPAEITVLMKQCWANNPMERPRLAQIKSIMKESERNNGTHGSILDTLIHRMELHTQELERVVEEKAQQFVLEKEKSEALLYQILPRTVVDQLKKGEHVKPENFDMVTVYYSDIVSFTTLSSRSAPTEVVNLLNDLYTIFDGCIMKFDAYKVETIGDCYVVASGVPIRNGDQHAAEICRLSLLLLEEIRVFKIRHMPDEQLRLRLGAHTGPCVSGVVGLVMPRFCLFGETITIAAKMESSSQPMRIQISAHCERVLQTKGSFETEEREAPIRINENLEIQTYWLNSERL